MLVMPTAWDQPDNAARAVRLGVARVIPRPRYSPSRVASELLRLQSDEYRRRASAVGDRTKQEGGVRAACDAIESHLDRATPSDRSV
jgi:UDP:flavonoid glycosyltransferase YjiC (YdhE family)